MDITWANGNTTAARWKDRTLGLNIDHYDYSHYNKPWFSATCLGQTEDEVRKRYWYQLEYALDGVTTNMGFKAIAKRKLDYDRSKWASKAYHNITNEQLKLYFPNGPSQWLSNYMFYLKS